MLKFLRRPFRLLAILLIIFVIYANVRLYDEPVCITIPYGQIDCETLDQLHYLRRILQEHRAAEEMETLYPEGFVFTYALYALAWSEVASLLPPESVSQQEGVQEIAFSLEQLQSKNGTMDFNAALPLPYGAFYRGWTTYVAGKFLQLLPPAQRDSAQIARFQNDCEAIARSIQATENPYLESYTDMAWPADNIVCLAALALHDRFLEPRYQSVRTIWLARIKTTLDIRYQLIPHRYDLATQQSPEGVRGASQSLMLCFLPQIDSDFAQQQYQNYRSHFLTYRLGLPGIREYPDGTGLGDIDSGPVIMGIGGAASIVGIRASALQKDWQLHVPLRQSVKTLLFPKDAGKERSYLFGQLPIIDAFMAWSNAGICQTNPLESDSWRWKLQVISLCFLAFLGALLWRFK